MTTTYDWTFTAIKTDPNPADPLADVVVSFEVRVRADDGETEGHGDWYAGVHLGPPDPESFTPFPTDPADTPAFRDWLKARALETLDMTEAQIEAAALSQLEAFKTRPIARDLP